MDLPRNQNDWNKILAPYKKADNRSAVAQLANTAIPFVVLWYLMLLSLEISYALTLILAVVNAGFVMRLFIFQHDCGHGSFFSSRRANNALGFVLGVLTLTPYLYWRRTHAIHHATSGNLDRREFGEVATWTVREYLDAPWWKRLGYRFYRSPLALLVIGPTFQFVVKHRIPWDAPLSWKKEWLGVLWTNLALAAVVVGLGEAIGYSRLFLVHGPIFLVSGAVGIWLFYVQHQFEDTYWEKQDDWEFDVACLQGSSFYDLPRWLHWVSGNIGYHHIHHLASLVPNYRLRACMEENPVFEHVTRINLRDGWRCLWLKLWDEESRELVGFRHLRAVEA